jgi:hypothetical protein
MYEKRKRQKEQKINLREVPHHCQVKTVKYVQCWNEARTTFKANRMYISVDVKKKCAAKFITICLHKRKGIL